MIPPMPSHINLIQNHHWGSKFPLLFTLLHGTHWGDDIIKRFEKHITLIPTTTGQGNKQKHGTQDPTLDDTGDGNAYDNQADDIDSPSLDNDQDSGSNGNESEIVEIEDKNKSKKTKRKTQDQWRDAILPSLKLYTQRLAWELDHEEPYKTSRHIGAMVDLCSLLNSVPGIDRLHVEIINTQVTKVKLKGKCKPVYKKVLHLAPGNLRDTKLTNGKDGPQLPIIGTDSTSPNRIPSGEETLFLNPSIETLASEYAPKEWKAVREKIQAEIAQWDFVDGRYISPIHIIRAPPSHNQRWWSVKHQQQVAYPQANTWPMPRFSPTSPSLTSLP